MALHAVISSFKTGTYSVSRAGAGTYSGGYYVPAAASLFSITACIQPVAGRELQALPEAQHGEEVRVIYTTTELRTRTPTNQPDVVTINGEAWEIWRVERWEAFGGDTSGDHYRCYASRVTLP